MVHCPASRLRPGALLDTFRFEMNGREGHRIWPSITPPAKRDTAMNQTTKTELEAAAFRRLVAHLQGRNDVQNIDMMNLAGFCRNCLSRWYREEAATKGVEMDDAAAREIVYGMDYAEWKAQHQTEASDAQRAAYEQNHKHD